MSRRTLCPMSRGWQYSNNTGKISAVCGNEVYKRCVCSQARIGENNIQATPMKCLDLEDTRGFTEAGGLALHCFYCSYPFSPGGTILLGKFGRRWVEVFIYVQVYAGSWLEVPYSTGRGGAGHLDQVILLVWPNSGQSSL